MKDVVVKVEKLVKSYGNNFIFEDYNLEVFAGEFVMITGESGCGKSTLLNMIGLLDKADSGNLTLFSFENVKPFSRKAQQLLKEKIGYLFQNYALIDHETVFENLKFLSKSITKQKAEEALLRVGLENVLNKKIYQLLGGQQQRVALARLMLKPCELILADEPTGSLDEKNKDLVMSVLNTLHQEGKTIILVSHDMTLKQYASRIIEL